MFHQTKIFKGSIFEIILILIKSVLICFTHFGKQQAQTINKKNYTFQISI